MNRKTEEQTQQQQEVTMHPTDSNNSHTTSLTRNPNEDHDSSTDSFEENDRVHEFTPPFLVRTKSRPEKENLRRQYQENRDENKRRFTVYDTISRFFERFSASALLENKAAVARDHLANERTFLAWLRTSLSLVTVGVAITQLYNLNPSNNAHAGRAVGATFVILSIVFLYMANARYFHSQVSLTKDHFPASRGAILFGSTAVLAVLIAMFTLIVIDQKHH
ncbi:hypothetical protein INT45_012796 [Circinella minor]|uniref:DUF202 domain-containing protein n=1 Tax=Circinella minor TaxID=1195481 RepID=A0A8H7VHR4_9FUNG|nr:hypothetical protein INT45_012796 [Circinella minor]